MLLKDLDIKKTPIGNKEAYNLLEYSLGKWIY